MFGLVALIEVKQPPFVKLGENARPNRPSSFPSRVTSLQCLGRVVGHAGRLLRQDSDSTDWFDRPDFS